MTSRLLNLAAFLFIAIVATPGLPSAAADAEMAKPLFKFQFSSGQAAPGCTVVAADMAYSKERGYGFEPGGQITVKEFCTSDKPFFFSIALPEGNYLVTVGLGDPAGESETTVKAELRRLMLENVHAAAGQVATRSFVVNVRTPAIAGGGRVGLKAPRETVDEAWAWDGRLTLEFNGRHPCLRTLEIAPAQVPTLFLLGDSTVCDQSKEPYASWGQMLPRFFKPGIAVANHAESGETLRGSTNARRFAKVLGDLKPGDYLLIQFGHNDQKDKSPDASKRYAETLTSWVRQVKQKGGIPVLITSMYRHRFEGNRLIDSLADYPDKVRAVARAEKTALIDLHAMSKELYEALGPEQAAQLFKHETPDAKDFDRTHHNPYGAYELARCIVEGLRLNCPELAKQISDDLPAFSPAKPDPATGFKVPPSPGFTTQRPLGD